jgi:hypothetical protein
MNIGHGGDAVRVNEWQFGDVAQLRQSRLFNVLGPQLNRA